MAAKEVDPKTGEPEKSEKQKRFEAVESKTNQLWDKEQEREKKRKEKEQEEAEKRAKQDAKEDWSEIVPD